MAPTRRTLFRDQRLVLMVALLPAILYKWAGRDLTGLSLKIKGDHWMLVVQATDGRNHWVTFYRAAGPWACLSVFASDLKANHIRWYPDRYPPDMGS